MDLIDVKFPQPDKERLLRDLLTIVIEGAVLQRTEDTKPYECDGLAVYRNLPLTMVPHRAAGSSCAEALQRAERPGGRARRGYRLVRRRAAP
jgi:hypothetical protein